MTPTIQERSDQLTADNASSEFQSVTAAQLRLAGKAQRIGADPTPLLDAIIGIS